MKLTFERVVVSYWLIALLTFGYTASNTDCRQSFMSMSSETECRAFKGMVGGALWPLHWTWAAFDAARTALQEKGERG